VKITGRAGWGVTALVALVAACSNETASPPVDPEADASYVASAAVGPCAAIMQRHPIEGQTHVATCSYVKYQTNPPSSGDHYSVWGAFTTYTEPLPEGFWVHDLEHGAIVLTYNCPGGCDDEVAAAQAMIDAYPDDPICTQSGGTVRHRFVMTPDPGLDVRFAASAWGWTLRANCFDKDAFLAFARARYGFGPEVLCQDGVDVVGTSGDPPGCGAAPASN